MSRKPPIFRLPGTQIPRLDRTSRTLQKALALLDDGQAWTTGMRHDVRNGRVVMCSLGAIEAATSSPWRRRRAIRRLGRVASKAVWRGVWRNDIWGRETTEMNRQRIAEWNDCCGQWSEVRRGFERAIANHD